MKFNSFQLIKWPSVNELRKLSNLEEVRFISNPLNNTDQATNIREGFIARIKSMKTFNRTKIHTNDRQGAEIDYMKKNLPEYLSAKESEIKENFKKFLENHPRYTELIESNDFIIVKIFITLTKT